MGDDPKQKSKEVTANANNSVNSSKLDKQQVSSAKNGGLVLFLIGSKVGAKFLAKIDSQRREEQS